MRPRPSTVAILVSVVALTSCKNGITKRERKLAQQPPTSAEVSIEDHPALIATYPCSGCHDKRKPNPTPRQLSEYHTQKNFFDHGTKVGWCYRCHSIDDIDKLHTQGGTPVEFMNPQELCGSCHGDKLIDWKAGLHGLNRGSWNGPKLRRSCTFCHNPHKPAFEPMVPERPPDIFRPTASNGEPKT